ncbi:MBL fold metallo-hydrolase [Fulvivirga sediminis]|uniref:MBL fold metallo-hydrolase n=1 Tax=Fulvivirga sediminis TaxID=2803949 RepID=A0A937F6I6_9BACT|nr:MBL fold metallo-hydrolase [Fulvivirga sediminis]MBL3655927.1 MBL fold metallo-hydrolase [Fulvivirga sediminis]
MSDPIKIQLVRNATLFVHYGGARFLIDPMFADKGAYPGFPGTYRAELRNPLVDLPLPPHTWLKPDLVLLTHLHPDHWDAVAAERLPKETPVYVQNEDDAEKVKADGFSKVNVLEQENQWGEMQIFKTVCQHGSDDLFEVPEMAARMGSVSGYVFKKANEKTIYLIGDTIWIDEVEEALMKHEPDIVIMNTGNAQVNGFGNIIMGQEDVLRVHQLLPKATIIAIHMEAINHCALSRKDLKAFVDQNQLNDYVIIPEDGEEMRF